MKTIDKKIAGVSPKLKKGWRVCLFHRDGCFYGNRVYNDRELLQAQLSLWLEVIKDTPQKRLVYDGRFVCCAKDILMGIVVPV